MDSKDILDLLEARAKKLKKKKKEKEGESGNKKSKFLAIVNDETGEIEGYFQLKPKYLSEGGEFMALFQQSADYIAEQGLKGETYNVLMKLIARMDYDNWIRISQKDIAESLHIKQQNVSRAMKELLDKDIIQEAKMRAGLNKCYRFNPLIGHKGKNIKQTIIDYEELKRKKKIRLEELEELPTPFDDVPANIDPETGEVLD